MLAAQPSDAMTAAAPTRPGTDANHWSGGPGQSPSGQAAENQKSPTRSSPGMPWPWQLRHPTSSAALVSRKLRRARAEDGASLHEDFERGRGQLRGAWQE
jgi:hypothetical protein